MAACTATFTACNSDESSLPTAGNQLQLSFGINAPESRAIFTDTKLPDNSPVGVRLDGYADYANLVYTGSTTSGTQSWTSTTSVTLTDTKGTLYAYWPQSNAVSIDAIDVDMTAADQTDWLYATPVTDVNEDKASVAVNMNHALANINIKVNKGSYKGAAAISNITLQSDGIALGGTFNAVQTAPGYTAFEDEGKPLSRTVSTTAGAAATDIMVVPTGTSAAVTFLLTIDGIQFTATSAAVQLAMGNSYQYTLNLSDISTYMEISGFSVKPWTTVTGGTLDLTQKLGLNWDNAPNGVYAVSAEGLPVAVADADESCIAVALIVNDAPVPQAFWIEKYEYIGTSNVYEKAQQNALADGKLQFDSYDCIYDFDSGIPGSDIHKYTTADGVNQSCFLPDVDGNQNNTPLLTTDYRAWTTGAISDFNGAFNTNEDFYRRYSPAVGNPQQAAVGYLMEIWNSDDNSDNLGYNDWYIPSLGQLGLIVLYYTEIENLLSVIGGKELFIGSPYQNGFWSSTTKDTKTWHIDLGKGKVDADILGRRVRFIRNCRPIYFYIEGQQYAASDGMKWTNWIESPFNSYGFYNFEGFILNSEGSIINECITNEYIGSGNSYTLSNVIKFNIGNNEILAVKGMTWEQFANSRYNVVNNNTMGIVYLSGDDVYSSVGFKIKNIKKDDVIVDNGEYVVSSPKD